MDSSRDNMEAALAANRQFSTPYNAKNIPTRLMLILAYEAIGIVYGDIGTSPLYVYATTFTDYPLTNNADLVGALSLIIWSLTLSPLLKYCWVVLTCDDNGEGGTFAAYGILSRNLQLGLPGREGRSLSYYTVEQPKGQSAFVENVKSIIRNSQFLRGCLLTIVLTATCMIIGDGVLTPAQSILSAIGGIQVSDPSLSQDVVVAVSCVLLAILFIFQRYGTAKIGFTFAPIVIVWLLTIAVIGLWNLGRFNAWWLFKAFSPHYGILFLTRNGRGGWLMLGGIFLTITGTEAMYADLGHFTALSVQLAFTFFAYPCLLLAYIGQAAWLTGTDGSGENFDRVGETFYLSIPQTKGLYWPIFVVATAAAGVASQAMISATFSIVNQSMSLGCFPRMRVMHTSTKVKGQIYMPEINYILMVLCLLIAGIMGQQGTTTIGHAYGIAVSAVMLITTFLITLILMLVKQWSPFLYVPFFLFYFFAEGVYLSSNLDKVPQGGWVPLAFAGSFLTVMSVWRYGTYRKHQYMMEQKLSMDWVVQNIASNKVSRVPGLGLFYSDLRSGIPPVFSHFLASVPAIHEVVVYIAIQRVEVPTVLPEERCLVTRVGPVSARMYRCVVRYGYNDLTKEQANTLSDYLVDALTLFIRTEDAAVWKGESKIVTNGDAEADDGQSFITMDDGETRALKDAEVTAIAEAKQNGVVHVVGRTYMKAKDGFSFKNLVNRFIIDYLYYFLKANTVDAISDLSIPKDLVLEVGMFIDV